MMRQAVRDLEYELGGVLVETQLVRGLNRETSEVEDRFMRLFTDVRDTAENLALFYRMKKELEKRFEVERIHAVTFPVGVL